VGAPARRQRGAGRHWAASNFAFSNTNVDIGDVDGDGTANTQADAVIGYFLDKGYNTNSRHQLSLRGYWSEARV
jgi:hypothetical protein